MCGLVGQAGNLEFSDEALHKRLLLLDYWRGPDSTGMASIRKNGEVKIAKIDSHPLALFDTKRFASALSGSQSMALIGHNRAATKGKINEVNAHPFQYGHIVGAHNGTLDYQSFRELQEALDEEFDVDSQAIFAGIAKWGLKKTIGMLSGAWSLVYFDLEKNTLNWLRNKERPLYFAYAEDFKKVYWASDDDYIDAAVRTGVSAPKLHSEIVKTNEVERTVKFWSTAENIHYAFDVKAMIEGGSKPKPKVVEIKGKEAEVKKTTCGFVHDPFERHGTLHTMGSGKTATTKSGSSPTSVVHLLGLASDPYAGVINKDDFEQLASYGCSWCSASVEWGEKGVVIFERDDVLLCSKCANTGESSRVVLPNLESLLC